MARRSFRTYLPKPPVSLGVIHRVKTIIAGFIPIIIIYLLLVLPDTFAQIADSSLGRIFFVTCIVFYTFIDVILGILVCLLVIMYYQSDIVALTLNNDWGKEPFVATTTTTSAQTATAATNTTPIFYKNVLLRRDDLSGALFTADDSNNNNNISSKSSSDSDTDSEDGDRNSRMNDEEEIIFPKLSNDWYARIMTNLYNLTDGAIGANDIPVEAFNSLSSADTLHTMRNNLLGFTFV